MFVPQIWLRDFVDIPEDIKVFDKIMTRSGTMVEGYEYRGEGLENIVSARVETIERHPDSDHMWVCSLTDGKNTYQVVTGAQNVKAGDIVPLAKDGATVSGGKKIVTSELRGVRSEGMLCSGEELGMSGSIIPKKQENGIYILESDTPLGEDIKSVLGLDDYVVEFELTNNRQDCNSVLGIAYEASAAQHRKFDIPAYEYDDGSDDIRNYVDITVKNHELCPRYTARMVKILKVEDSPMWMQIRLMGSGVRPINNIVDVSNYVMLETGQPLHTFDYDKIAGKKVIIDTANDGDVYVTLDGEERKLDSSMLMIDDASGHICVAGVMGGANSEIDDDTKYVLIEAANFNGPSVRNTAKALGMRTEASAHFEKGISRHLTKYAADRAVSLLVQIGAAEAIGGVIDLYDELPSPEPVTMNMDWFNRFIGTELTVDDAVKYLDCLCMDPVVKGRDITVTPPKYRQDINIKEDVAEEVIRIHGYANIPLRHLESSNYISDENRYYRAKQEIKKLLVDIGGYDTLTYAFISPSKIDALGLKEDDPRNRPLKLINPLGEDTSTMRTTMVPNMLDSLRTNYLKKNKAVTMFEIGSVYLENPDKNDLALDIEKLVIGKFGCDFYEIKSVLNYLFESLRLTDVRYDRADEVFLHPGRSAYVYLNGENIGFIGQIHPTVAKKFDLCEDTVVAELTLRSIIERYLAVTIRFQEPAKYPAVSRDLALVMDEALQAGDIGAAILELGGEFITGCEVFDVYRSDALGEAKKSIAYSLTFRSPVSTLKDEQVEEAIGNILSGLKDKFGIVIRA